MSGPRVDLIATLRRDLIGPQHGDDEILSSRPGDQYMTGALFPQDAEADASESDERASADGRDDDPDEAVSMTAQRRPSSMGISFAVDATEPRLLVTGSAGRYRRAWETANGLTNQEGERKNERWVRSTVTLDTELTVRDGLHYVTGPGGLRWCVRGLRGQSPDGAERWQVTVVLSNMLKPCPGRVEAEAATFFQAGFAVRPVTGRLVPREVRRAVGDADTETNEVIYRHAREWAVGHTCGATWPEAVDVGSVETAWLPQQRVTSMDERGHPIFRGMSRERLGDEKLAFSADALGTAGTTEQLTGTLAVLADAYESWLDRQGGAIDEHERTGALRADQVDTARRQLEAARSLARRIRSGVEILGEDATARRAFQLAQRAMVLQRRWTDGSSLVWRPFQLGFQLLSLAGLARPGSDSSFAEQRATMDLLWFPTGGGKTEAYLALIAFVLFHRRLRQEGSPDDGRGVAVLMRYTLRLLTVQQFERASRLVLACEWMRRDANNRGDTSLGEEAFSIGLWVGRGATPNTVEEARREDGRLKARQLVRCPACRSDECLKWDAAPDSNRYIVESTGHTCPFQGTGLPVHTIDEEIYAAAPSLLIGTIDKFAQIVRNERTHQILGGGETQPPELIIQDELHLISGPLGTIAGLYESALDQLCTWNGLPPKVIGSTATIRRADDQVRALFRRKVAQFPPPVLDSHDSCFAVVDSSKPGRIYVGVTTAGRSPKFVLQAVCASLMQGAYELPESVRDPYWTLVAYFNSLRELGGALVMMYDDVRDSISVYSRSHGQQARQIDEDPLELTSRVGSDEIPGYLDELSIPYPAQRRASVLATNMLSVGVDIPRLGLMVVNGQPKSMAEYIQATSRVGRQSVAGLIVTVYNAGRARDRSHYEAFRTWHQALYREVEATSVTPFAPRARDRALHAAIVALARHRVDGMLDDPDLTDARRSDLEAMVDGIVARAADIDPEEKEGVSADAAAFLDTWQRRLPLASYWNDRAPRESLLVGAETVAKGKAQEGAWNGAAIATPNSMREVEPEVQFQLVPGLKRGSAADATPGQQTSRVPMDEVPPGTRSRGTRREPSRGGARRGGRK